MLGAGWGRKGEWRDLWRHMFCFLLQVLVTLEANPDSQTVIWEPLLLVIWRNPSWSGTLLVFLIHRFHTHLFPLHFLSPVSEFFQVVTHWGSLRSGVGWLWGGWECPGPHAPGCFAPCPNWLQSAHPPPTPASIVQWADSLIPAWNSSSPAPPWILPCKYSANFWKLPGNT